MSTKTKPKAFEIYRIRLNMKSANVHVTHINKVTAPEFLIIRKIHGDGSAILVEHQGDDIETRLSEDGKWLKRVRPASALVEHLTNKYGREVFKSVFPGENPILPFTYEDAGLLGEQTVDATDAENGWEPMVKVEEPKADKKKGAAKAADDLIGAIETTAASA